MLGAHLIYFSFFFSDKAFGMHSSLVLFPELLWNPFLEKIPWHSITFIVKMIWDDGKEETFTSLYSTSYGKLEASGKLNSRVIYRHRNNRLWDILVFFACESLSTEILLQNIIWIMLLRMKWQCYLYIH